ncbi:butyrate kinase [Niallia sp. JL1B1071]|uniref:butyrate kinase n=1 Tax=Niallia tiangongensis TaxID=3237105 RepID=UPI0037DDDAA5
MSKFRILVINPRSFVTEIALYENEVPIIVADIHHEAEKIQGFPSIVSQYIYRSNEILSYLMEKGINLSKLAAVCGRGGLLKPIDGGTYIVNTAMRDDLLGQTRGEHPSNLGALIAYEIAEHFDIPSYIVDPVVVDEMDSIAKISGYPKITRKSVFHALNHKASGRRAAMELGKKYEEVQLIIAHLGGGITIGAHSNGRVIDVNNGLNGEGPFSIERSGTLPHGDLVDLCYSGEFSYEEMKHELLYHSGVMAYIDKPSRGVLDLEEELKKADNPNYPIFEALAYQIAKEIGSISTVLLGKVDAIILTGELAYSNLFVKLIMERVSWIADIMVYPGENERQSLAQGVLRVLRKEELAKEYLSKGVWKNGKRV